jgi:hypothetical protein
MVAGGLRFSCFLWMKSSGRQTWRIGCKNGKVQKVEGGHLPVFVAETERCPPSSFCCKNQKVPTFQFLQQILEGAYLPLFAPFHFCIQFSTSDVHYFSSTKKHEKRSPPATICTQAIVKGRNKEKRKGRATTVRYELLLPYYSTLLQRQTSKTHKCKKPNTGGSLQ